MFEVDVKGDTATITSTLDGRVFLKFAGETQSLSMLEMWKLPTKNSVGLMAYSPTTFHSVTLTPLDPTMRMTQPMPAKSDKPQSTDSSALTVLYDQAHGEPDGAALASLENRNSLFIQTLMNPISAATINKVDVLYLRAPRTRFAKTEIDAIVSFIRTGGSLLLVMDEERRTPLAATSVNEIIEPFGMAFTDDTPYLHNCGAIGRAGDIHSADREVPYSGGRAVTAGNAFGFQLDASGQPGQAFAASKIVEGGGRIVVLADGMAAGLMGNTEGKRLSGVSRDPSRTTYWGKDSEQFMSEILTWLTRQQSDSGAVEF